MSLPHLFFFFPPASFALPAFCRSSSPALGPQSRSIGDLKKATITFRKTHDNV
ncbi:hypothetical protein BDQ94DRAFT_155616 [Aspergillus welwitschiae]|uniref:Uncharacterized protein n=1 Tax=Aspergillus welwitschiae TaxID=1341132 RepID=A0A3F3PHP0_9EURO|nr:hypothetical protein BDQ94DRAFT_155616 [Aspergillus welwitschiae]RDH26377.1 hypothetical protein BDQ94DRAFT_155616 [Aspergillus welwitschiae]